MLKKRVWVELGDAGEKDVLLGGPRHLVGAELWLVLHGGVEPWHVLHGGGGHGPGGQPGPWRAEHQQL